MVVSACHFVGEFEALDMGDRTRLYVSICAASLIVVTINFAIVVSALATIPHVRAIDVKSLEKFAVVAVVVLPIGAASLWLFRTLQAGFTRHESKKVAMGFALFTPISLAVSMLFAEMSGGYAASLWGSSFGLLGAFVGAIAMTALLNLALGSFSLWAARHQEETAPQ
jgi:MFS family permease